MAAFRAPTRIHMRRGAIADLPAVVRGLAARRVLLVTDAGLERTPWPAAVRSALSTAGVAVLDHPEVEGNPRLATAAAAASRAREGAAAAVVGLGGGSVLDCAKAAAMLATNRGDPLDYVGRNRFPAPPLPMVAIPTTCGTGSEVTWVAVLTDPAARRKVSIKGDAMFPHTALVDADLVDGLPPALVAATAMDALTHALEATTATCANPVSDALAEAAIALLLARLEQAVAGAGAARAAVLRAATLAGLAFGSADVGAVHCLSETLGGRYDVAHGVANAMLLVPTFRAHGAAVEPRLASLHRALFPGRAGDDTDRTTALLDEIERLRIAVGIPELASLAIPPDDHAAIAEEAVANGSNAACPRPMGVPEYLAILGT